MHNRVTYCLGACLAIGLLGATAGADDVKVDALWYQKVRVIGLRDGRLLYTVRGANRDVDLKEVSGLKLEAHPEWEQADQAFDDGKFDQAITLLNKLADELGRRESYLRPLVLRRLVQAYDGAEQFTDALDKFIELVREEDGEFFITAAPTKLPANRDVRARAAKQIASVMEVVKPAARPILEKLSAALAADQPVAAPPSPPTTSANAQTGAEPATAEGTAEAPATTVEPVELTASTDDVARVHRDLDNRQYAEALKSIQILKTRRNAPLAELFYAEGLAQAGLSKPIDAAIAFMRVDVHFADSPLAVPALIQAGQMLKSADKTDQATNVWREAAKRTDDPATKQKVAQLLGSVGG